MSSNPGEYCARCGTKSDMMENSEGTVVYVCPRGHGEQGNVPVVEPSEPGEVPAGAEDGEGEDQNEDHSDDEDDEDDEEDDGKPAHEKPPPHKRAAARSAPKKKAKKK